MRFRFGKLTEIPPGTIVEKSIFARKIAIINHQGTLVGIESECKHMRASLTKGQFAGDTLTCPWHGWTYDVRTGACLNHPEFQLRRYQVEIDGDDVYVVI